MSRAAQKRSGQEALGYQDATTIGRFRWKKHPNLKSYKKGYNAGVKSKPKKPVEKLGFFGSLMAIIKGVNHE